MVIVHIHSGFIRVFADACIVFIFQCPIRLDRIVQQVSFIIVGICPILVYAGDRIQIISSYSNTFPMRLGLSCIFLCRIIFSCLNVIQQIYRCIFINFSKCCPVNSANRNSAQIISCSIYIITICCHTMRICGVFQFSGSIGYIKISVCIQDFIRFQ